VRKLPGRAMGRSRLLAGAAVLTTGALVGGLAITAGPAYADITTSSYTIGAPSGGVTNVVASPSGVNAGGSTSFDVSFTVPTALAGSSSDWVTVVPSESLGSAPTSIDLVGGSCIQAGTNGGAYSANGITVNLNTSCSLAAGSKAQVDFTANAPTSTGNFAFAVTTSKNATAGTSNSVSVSTAGPILTAASYASGANTTYTVNGVTVGSLTASGTTSFLLPHLRSGPRRSAS